MKNTEELYDALKNGLLSIRQVINMAKARPAHLMAPKHVGAPLTTTSTSAARAGKASVEYVRLRREEQANMIVLSGAEKYARAQAQFEPVELLNDKKKTRRGDYWSRSTQLLSEQIEAVLRTQGKNEVLY
ncbi:hypothetical protein PC119_g15743 [Phytophthora cactorum]|nr:hypothetical protein PC119_g15743 [Phytophthora cactorum]